MGRQVIEGKISESHRWVKYLSSRFFLQIYDCSSPRQKCEIHTFIDKNDTDGLKKYVDRLSRDHLDLFNVRRLRQIAANLLIDDYIHLSKAVLIERIEDARRDT